MNDPHIEVDGGLLLASGWLVHHPSRISGDLLWVFDLLHYLKLVYSSYGHYGALDIFLH